jgi:hypothetical protein
VFAVDRLNAKVFVEGRFFSLSFSVTGQVFNEDIVRGGEVFTARRKFVEAGDQLYSLGGGG